MNKTIEALAKAIEGARSTAVFTGAGMSTESGLPDFRSSQGLWGKYRPEDLASIDALNRNFDNFVDFYRKRISTLGEVKPHRGHELIARWEDRGLVSGVITQNVDGLHQAAGSKTVYELHGALKKVRCQSCGREYESDSFSDQANCEACGGKLRPGVVLFGEMLPEDALSSAIALAETCDLFLVLGSSLAVSPANYLPERAKRKGAGLYIVNRDPTPLDYMADGVINDSIGKVLEEVEIIIGIE